MASYRGNQRQDRAKAIAAVGLVHAALGAIILTGLDVRIVEQTVERLQTFDITPEAPPPPIPEPPPPPRPEESSAPEEEAAPANIKSKPTPVVAPRPPIPLPIPPPVNSSNVRGPEGLDRTAGASNRPGPGTGAGGQGSGFGGGGRGGTGAGSGGGLVSGPRLVAGGPTKADYHRLRARVTGRVVAVLRLTISPSGRVAECRVVRSTGYPNIDAGICPLLQPRMRWQPAMDRAGRPSTSWLDYIVPITRS